MALKYLSLSRRSMLVGVLVLLVSSRVLAVYDEGARYAFTASVDQKTVFIVDLYAHAVVERISVDTSPERLSASENLKALVIGDSTASRLILVDLTSDELDRYDYPLTLTPDYIKVSPLGETVAVYDADLGRLEVHALKRRQVLLQSDGVSSETGFTFNLDGSEVYWVDEESGALKATDLWSRTREIQLASGGAGFSAVSRSTDGLLAFVSSSRDSIVHVINLRTFTKLAEVRVGRDPGRPWGTADGRYLLIPNRGDDTVSVIATAGLRTVFTIDTVTNPRSVHPGWLDTTAAVIGELGDVVFIDLELGTAGEAHALGSTPHEGVVTSDSKTLAVPTWGSGGIHFFDMRKRVFVDRIQGLPGDLSAASLAVSNNLCH